MDTELIFIGTEVLLGEILNTNAVILSQNLTDLGLKICRQTVVGDNKACLISAINQAMSRAKLVITCGGLGPTVDDITTEAVTLLTNKKLLFHPRIFKQIKEHFRLRHIKMPACNRRQAYLPESAHILNNEFGTACGFIVMINKNYLVCLPGPPQELNPMFLKYVVPFLRRKILKNTASITKTIKIIGISESKANEIIKDLFVIKPDLRVGIYAHPEEIHIKITAWAKTKTQAQKKLKTLYFPIRQRLKKYIINENNKTLEATVAGLLIKSKKTLAIAESCSGGLLSHRLTNIPGSSKFYQASIIAYSYAAKTKLLGVDMATLKNYGAVSSSVCRQMAKNIRKLNNSDIGIAITGIAGPGGATKTKPIGLVYIAVSTKNLIKCEKFYFSGARETVKYKATQRALAMLFEVLQYD